MTHEDFTRTLLKAHVKGHYRHINGKVIYVHDHDNSKPQGRRATLSERTAIGKHKSGTHYLRATDAEDAKQIKNAAKELGIDLEHRRAGAIHHGRTGAYDHFHVQDPAHAIAIHDKLKQVQEPEEETPRRPAEPEGFTPGEIGERAAAADNKQSAEGPDETGYQEARLQKYPNAPARARSAAVEFGQRGISGSAILHPEHEEALGKLEPGQSHYFEDEQGTGWDVQRHGDDLHFNSRGSSGLRGKVPAWSQQEKPPVFANSDTFKTPESTDSFYETKYGQKNPPERAETDKVVAGTHMVAGGKTVPKHTAEDIKKLEDHSDYQGFGYLGHENREELDDKRIADAANRLGMDKHTLAAHLLGKSGRHMMDSAPDDLGDRVIHFREWLGSRKHNKVYGIDNYASELREKAGDNEETPAVATEASKGKPERNYDAVFNGRVGGVEFNRKGDYSDNLGMRTRRLNDDQQKAVLELKQQGMVFNMNPDVGQDLPDAWEAAGKPQFFIAKDKRGNHYLIDTQGYNYPRYAAKIDMPQEGGTSQTPMGGTRTVPAATQPADTTAANKEVAAQKLEEMKGKVGGDKAATDALELRKQRAASTSAQPQTYEGHRSAALEASKAAHTASTKANTPEEHKKAIKLHQEAMTHHLKAEGAADKEGRKAMHAAHFGEHAAMINGHNAMITVGGGKEASLAARAATNLTHDPDSVLPEDIDQAIQAHSQASDAHVRAMDSGKAGSRSHHSSMADMHAQDMRKLADRKKGLDAAKAAQAPAKKEYDPAGPPPHEQGMKSEDPEDKRRMVVQTRKDEAAKKVATERPELPKGHPAHEITTRAKRYNNKPGFKVMEGGVEKPWGTHQASAYAEDASRHAEGEGTKEAHQMAANTHWRAAGVHEMARDRAAKSRDITQSHHDQMQDAHLKAAHYHFDKANPKAEASAPKEAAQEGQEGQPPKPSDSAPQEEQAHAAIRKELQQHNDAYHQHMAAVKKYEQASGHGMMQLSPADKAKLIEHRQNAQAHQRAASLLRARLPQDQAAPPQPSGIAPQEGKGPVPKPESKLAPGAYNLHPDLAERRRQAGVLQREHGLKNPHADTAWKMSEEGDHKNAQEGHEIAGGWFQAEARKAKEAGERDKALSLYEHAATHDEAAKWHGKQQGDAPAPASAPAPAPAPKAEPRYRNGMTEAEMNAKLDKASAAGKQRAAKEAKEDKTPARRNQRMTSSEAQDERFASAMTGKGKPKDYGDHWVRSDAASRRAERIAAEGNPAAAAEAHEQAAAAHLDAKEAITKQAAGDPRINHKVAQHTEAAEKHAAEAKRLREGGNNPSDKAMAIAAELGKHGGKTHEAHAESMKAKDVNGHDRAERAHRIAAEVAEGTPSLPQYAGGRVMSREEIDKYHALAAAHREAADHHRKIGHEMALKGSK